jgi:DNA-binding CsgD family transcriptional regulator
MAASSFRDFDVVVDRLTIAVVVFRDERVIYRNPAAQALALRLRNNYRIELDVMLRDHLAALRDGGSGMSRVQPAITLMTASDGEPLYVHIIPIVNKHDDTAVMVRRLGTEFEAFRVRYGLSVREGQIAELVLHGYRNGEIATTLGITIATTKKHLTHVFDKVGVDSRNQLVARLA